jgi:hypothetical protein
LAVAIPLRRAALPERYQIVRLVIETHNQTPVSARRLVEV